MQQPEKVQFFQSESSFGSESSLSNSRYNDFTNDILAETDNIFLSLKRQLKPNENLLQPDKLKYTLSRAQLVQKDTIPEHQAYLARIEAPKKAKEQIQNCKHKLATLLTDYRNFKQGHYAYKDFYNKYGQEFGYQQGNFNKKKDLHIESNEDLQPELKPQYIQISYNTERQKLKATPRVFMTSSVAATDKEVTSLREEIYQLKRSMEENRKNHEQQLRNQKLNSERRLRTYLQMQSGSDPQISQMKEQLRQYSEQVSNCIEHNQNLQITLAEQKKTIETLKADNTSLQEQIQLRRRADSNAMDEDRSNRSYMSEVGDKDEKKLDKKVKNMQQENQLLKNQLKTERQRLYTIKTDLTEQERRQLERNRKEINKKTEELSDLYSKFDRQRIELLQLSQTAKSHSLRNQHLNTENQTLNQYIEKISTADLKPQILTKSADQSLQFSRNTNKCRVEEYEGDGIEGYAYYELLNKQFKTRFKRACLKEKQLLSKSNGVEIGVITNFQSPNTLTFLIHLTNYSDRILQKIRVKIMNPNGNKIIGDIFENAALTSNQQIKIPVSLHINYYPLGPLTLLLEYNVDKKEEVRLLLPCHIFKTVTAEERENNHLTNPTKLSLVPERKICKDFSDMKQYFKGVKGSADTMNLSLYHKQTHTLLHLNIEQTRDGLALLYEHIDGNKLITEYFIKTFAFLLSK